MKKLLLLSIFVCGFAQGSEQNKGNLSNKETAQLLANFANLPEEIKCTMFPEYSPELNALVYLKQIPKPAKNVAADDEARYWKNVFKPAKKIYQHWDLSYAFLKDQKPYFLYRSFSKYHMKLRRLGPNKNNIFLLDDYLYDYSNNCKQTPYLKLEHKQQRRHDVLVSSNAQDLKNKYIHEQFFTCIHPDKNLIVGIAKFDPKLSAQRPTITLTNYDSVTKKIDIQTVNVPTQFELLAFDNNNLGADALWAIDSHRKLWHLDKIHDSYESTCCTVSQDVCTISQSKLYPHLLLINGKYLHKIDNKSLTCVKTLEYETTFVHDRMSLEEGYLVPTIKEHALIVKPLGPLIQQAKNAVFKNNLKNLKQAILQIQQPGRNVL